MGQIFDRATPRVITNHNLAAGPIWEVPARVPLRLTVVSSRVADILTGARVWSPAVRCELQLGTRSGFQCLGSPSYGVTWFFARYLRPSRSQPCDLLVCPNCEYTWGRDSAPMDIAARVVLANSEFPVLRTVVALPGNSTPEVVPNQGVGFA
jgi:hypothetical protein